MLQKEVVIAPTFKFWVEMFAERIACVFGGLVPVHYVGLVAVIGGQVVTTAKPPYRFRALFFGDKKAHIGVTGRHIGVVRVNHERYAHGFKCSARQLGAVCRRRGRHLRAVNMGEVHSTLFNYLAVGEHTRAAATALGAGPGVFNKIRATIFGGECGTNAVLQIK